MKFSSLMVHLDLGASNEALLRLAADLAERSGAGVTGIVACQPVMLVYTDATMSGDLIQEDHALMRRQLGEAEDQFRTMLRATGRPLQWRCSTATAQAADWLADQLGGADLLLASPGRTDAAFDSARRVDLGDVLMRAGRPLLVVPPACATLDLDRAVVGWRDTRESRRAALDALPLLRQAGRVTVVEVVETGEEAARADRRLDDAVAWLEGHGVAAHSLVERSDTGAASRLEAVCEAQRAGLLVIGAYGHSRLREWALGGVTRRTLTHPRRCSFLSH